MILNERLTDKMKLTFSDKSKSPKELGLPVLKIKSLGKTVYRPQFYSDANGLLVEFGHYWGFGCYYVESILEMDTGLDLCGYDRSSDSSIELKEINKFIKYVTKYGNKLNKISKAKI